MDGLSVNCMSVWSWRCLGDGWGRAFFCIVKNVRLVSLGRAAIVLFCVTGMHDFLKIRGCLGCFAGEFWVVSKRKMIL